jgi:hypothetical protein
MPPVQWPKQAQGAAEGLPLAEISHEENPLAGQAWS